MGKAKRGKAKAKAQSPTDISTLQTVPERVVKVQYETNDCEISYADLYTIQHYPKEFIVSFFQTSHPLVFQQQDLEELKEIAAYCVHRIALRPDQMLEFSEAVRTNVEAWKTVNMVQPNLVPDPDPKLKIEPEQEAK